jgi:hypothetical protein
MHTLTTNLLTLIAVHPKRGVEAINAIGVLPGFTGTIVHDGYSPYEVFDAATHAQCGAHLLRHLDDVGQAVAFELWTSQLATVLIDAQEAAEAAADNGQRSVEATVATALRARYHSTLDVAFALLPPGPPPRRSHRGGWSVAQRKAWNLATRMRTGADDVLRCLSDTRVSLDNNVAERALRMVKLHEKISGCFHSLDGAESFAATRSYLQTAHNQNQNLIDVLRQLFTTRPWLPPATASP